MKRFPKLRDFSITTRVTTWYVIVITLIAAIVFGFVIYMSDSVMESSAREELEETVESHLPLLSAGKDGVTVDTAQIEFFINGVYLLVYSEDQTLLKGYLAGIVRRRVAFEKRLIVAVAQKIAPVDIEL
ncbi:MAG: hypothetical protein LIO46_02025, partial [Clostridiales bacterium]|nr:hypothetical protein [Clostridiales bacterium]